jgi:hypothetical protein
MSGTIYIGSKPIGITGYVFEHMYLVFDPNIDGNSGDTIHN